MLEEFFVDNYKSLINVTFRPHPENLLLGANNAGKTNLCQALRFLAATAVLSLDQCADAIAGMRQSITNYYLKQSTIHFRAKAVLPFEKEKLSYRYDLVITLKQSAMSTPQLEVEEESLYVTGQGFNDVLLIENTAQGVRLLHEDDYANDGMQNYVETSAPRDTTMLNRLYDLKTNKRANHFKTYLYSWQYFALSAEALRGSNHRPNWAFLAPDGSNLASCVYQLKTSNERWYRRLLGYLQRIDPRIDLINFVVGSEDRVFMFFEDKAGNSLPAANASSGTLRFLGLAYILTGQPSHLFPLFMIEEPENGIYVSFLKDVLEMARESPYIPQLVFTSHSPYFVDLFDDHPESVFIIKGGKEHSSIEQPDPEKIRRNLETFPLGEQHFREMLT